MSDGYTRSEHTIGYGKRVEYSTDGTTWIRVNGTIEASFPERELGTVEITNDDTLDRIKDYIATLFEGGDLSFKYLYTRSQFAALETIYQSAGNLNGTIGWRIILPDGSMGTVIRAIMIKHPLPLEIEKVPEVEVTVKALAKMVFVAGTGSIAADTANASPSVAA